jgi:hypothetical protein
MGFCEYKGWLFITDRLLDGRKGLIGGRKGFPGRMGGLLIGGGRLKLVRQLVGRRTRSAQKVFVELYQGFAQFPCPLEALQQQFRRRWIEGVGCRYLRGRRCFLGCRCLLG